MKLGDPHSTNLKLPWLITSVILILSAFLCASDLDRVAIASVSGIHTDNSSVQSLVDSEGSIGSAFNVENSSLYPAGCKPELAKKTGKTGDIIIPDTLEITFNKPIKPVPGVTNLWEALLMYYPGNDRSQDPVIISLFGRPEPLTEDDTKWLIPFINRHGERKLVAGDSVHINPQAPYVIALSELVNNAISAGFRSEIIGLANDREIHKWVPPYGLTDYGTIDEAEQLTCKDCMQDLVAFPTSCLSSLMVLTEIDDGPYTASLNIYDHLGKWLHSSVHRFGHCGELKDHNRYTSWGAISNDIIWNQRDNKGRLVGSGVYIWKVLLNFKNGNAVKFSRKLGIVRNEIPSMTCAAENR